MACGVDTNKLSIVKTANIKEADLKNAWISVNDFGQSDKLIAMEFPLNPDIFSDEINCFHITEGTAVQNCSPVTTLQSMPVLTEDGQISLEKNLCSLMEIVGSVEAIGTKPIQQLSSIIIQGNKEDLKSTFECVICQFHTDAKLDLKSHMQVHTLKLLICDFCSFSTYIDELFVDHKKEHTRKDQFLCSICSYKTRVRADLTLHLKIHLGEMRYTCGLCKFKANSKYKLAKHVIQYKPQKFYCNYCVYSSTRKLALQHHILRVHLNSKQFKCAQCPFETNHKMQLIFHVAQHMRMKLYRNRANHKSANLPNFRNRVMFRLCYKPFMCHKCDYRSSSLCRLKQHSRLHSVRKIFCAMCNFKTYVKNRFIDHLLRHTGEVVLKSTFKKLF